MSTRGTILRYLGSFPDGLTLAELAEATGLAETRIGSELQRCRKTGYVHPVAGERRLRWRLGPAPSPAALSAMAAALRRCLAAMRAADRREPLDATTTAALALEWDQAASLAEQTLRQLDQAA